MGYPKDIPFFMGRKEYQLNYPFGKKPREVVQYTMDGKMIKKFKSVSDASKQFEGVNARPNITRCCQNFQKSAYGYKWQYAD